MIERGVFSISYLTNSKKGQTTIFVVIGVILLGAIIAFFAFRGGSNIEFSGSIDENPESFFSSCINGKLREAVEIVSLNGGYINSSLSERFMFGTEPYQDITYLCYNQNNYFPCINQKPGLFADVENNLENYISADVENCFNEMSQSLEVENEVSLEYRSFEIDLLPRRILIHTDSSIVLSKSDTVVEYSDLESVLSSRLYEIVLMSQEIINQEAEYCYAETLGIQLTYPEFLISRYFTGEFSIYTVEHRENFEKFRFAVRGCVIPLGIGLSSSEDSENFEGQTVSSGENDVGTSGGENIIE